MMLTAKKAFSKTKTAKKRATAVRAVPLPWVTAPVPPPIVVVKSTDVANAWSWFYKNMSNRPLSPGPQYIYDSKTWLNGTKRTSLEARSPFIDVLSLLYFASQLGDFRAVIGMVNGGAAPDIIIPLPNLDPDITVVVKNKKRFRHALSEHLSFWIQIATLANVAGPNKFASALPNFQPEDKGPDGLSMLLGSSAIVEVYSVKSSISNPAGLISCTKFRKHGRPNNGKQLDDFWRCANRGWGFGRLDRLLEHVCGTLDFSPQQTIRFALLQQCNYNALVVADSQYAKNSLFEGYQRITKDVARRIATYVGSSSWTSLAEQTRRRVRLTLSSAGVK